MGPLHVFKMTEEEKNVKLVKKIKIKELVGSVNAYIFLKSGYFR
jgi:hypothetical protein